ncbi:hypothetical protein DMUE_0905 [Dictyocoela muelleri]|nr:hypothetical protein DMUE_0905 [Dictyocoela muelleri]
MILIHGQCFDHRTAEIRDASREKGYILIFLHSYTLQLNPIKDFFACLKSHVRERGSFTDRVVLIGIIDNILQNNGFKMSVYYQHMRTWLIAALSHQDFI